MARSDVSLILLGWPLEPTQHIAAAKDRATYARRCAYDAAESADDAIKLADNAINSADIEHAETQTKRYPLRDSLDIHRYPSLVSVTATPPPSNPSVYQLSNPGSSTLGLN